MQGPMNICITGACGNIAFSLYSFLCLGDTFGLKIDINLRLLDIQSKANHLKALKVELEDCCFDHLLSVKTTIEYSQGFQDADLVIFLGSMPRKPGMEIQEFYQLNAEIFSQQGKALNKYAKKTCKSLVVANPPNTNCLVLSSNAPQIPSKNFTSLLRWDQNKMNTQVTFIFTKLAHIFNCQTQHVKNSIIWGTHSTNQFRDITLVKIENLEHKFVKQKLSDIDLEYLSKKINSRNQMVFDAIGSSCFISVAKSIIDHLRDWFLGSQNIVSMGIILKEQVYGIQNKICFSVPTICIGNGQYSILKDLELTQSQNKGILECKEEIEKKKNFVKEYIPVNFSPK